MARIEQTYYTLLKVDGAAEDHEQPSELSPTRPQPRDYWVDAQRPASVDEARGTVDNDGLMAFMWCRRSSSANQLTPTRPAGATAPEMHPREYEFKYPDTLKSRAYRTGTRAPTGTASR